MRTADLTRALLGAAILALGANACGADSGGTTTPDAGRDSDLEVASDTDEPNDSETAHTAETGPDSADATDDSDTTDDSDAAIDARTDAADDATEDGGDGDADTHQDTAQDIAGDTADTSTEASQRLRLTIENRSDETALPSTFSESLVLLYRGLDFLPFLPGSQAPAGLGALATHGDALTMLNALPSEEEAPTLLNAFLLPGPIAPGETQSVEFDLPEGWRDAHLNILTQLEEGNDLFFGLGPRGYPAYADGALVANFPSPLVWDAGAEADELPGQGLQQVPRSTSPLDGSPEGVLRTDAMNRRALPPAQSMLQIEVSEREGGYTIDVIHPIDNPVNTPLVTVFWGTHQADASLFTVGAAASPGLELLAEDADASGLLTELAGSSGWATASATTEVLAPGEGTIADRGERYRFDVEATSPFSQLSLATMVIQTNDAFIATLPAGVSMFDDAGEPLSAEALQTALNGALRVWDAGTEANQVPGLGDAQPASGTPRVGDPDPNAAVRLYDDVFDDLAGAGASDVVSIDVASDGDSLVVRVSNVATSAGWVLTPVLIVGHDARPVFVVGEAPTEGVAALAEDGNAEVCAVELRERDGVTFADVASRSTDDEVGPLRPGATYAFTVDLTGVTQLTLASMIVPSNDTFWSASARLVDDSGRRSDLDIVADLVASLTVWNAGSERDEASAIGVSQPPFARPGEGVPEGNGTVRRYSDSRLPAVGQMIRLTLEEVGADE